MCEGSGRLPDPVTSNLKRNIDFFKIFSTRDVRLYNFPQPYISRGTFLGRTANASYLLPKADLLLDEADSDAPVSIALDTSRKTYDTLPEDWIHE